MILIVLRFNWLKIKLCHCDFCFLLITSCLVKAKSIVFSYRTMTICKSFWWFEKCLVKELVQSQIYNWSIKCTLMYPLLIIKP